MTKIVCISDTHMLGCDIPDGDILIHAGDLTFSGTFNEIADSFETLRAELVGKKFKHMLFVPGNHDWLFEESPELAKLLAEKFSWTLCLNELIEIDGIKFFGSPVQPVFHNWAFNNPDDYREKFWENAPDCDVLITHCPAYGLRDQVESGEYVGCKYIRNYINRVTPKVAICGHIHHSYGLEQYKQTIIINAAVCNEQYQPTNSPITFEL